MRSAITRVSRRSLLAAAGALAATPLASGAYAQSSEGSPAVASAPETVVSKRRKLSSLEVSAIGLGVQNMSRTYQMTVPTRTEMHNIIRAAFDHGVIFFDAAEAYGPHGTTQMAHMLENMGAASIEFSRSEVAGLNAAVAAIEVRGQRLPDTVLAYSGVEAAPRS